MDNYIASWSGGKDCCFACYQAMKHGYRVSHLLNSISQEFNRVVFHGTEARLIQIQARAIGIPLVQQETTCHGYEEEFKETVKGLIATEGIRGIIFGSIQRKEWEEKICGELGIEAVTPLLNQDPEGLLTDFLGQGFEAVIIAAQQKFIEQRWLGRKLDVKFIHHLRSKNIDLSGENGEYHTLVTSGPMFKRSVNIGTPGVIERDEFWFLDIRDYHLN